MDMVVRTDRMPAPGQTVLGEDFTTSPGGKGANQAVAAARLGASCAMIGRVGDDTFGEQLTAHLQAENVDTEAIMSTDGVASGVAVISVDGKGENAIVVASGANFRVTPDDLFWHEQAFEQADVVLLQLELPIPTVRAAIMLARRHGATVILDPAPVNRPLPDELYKVDIITPNVSEAQILTGTQAIEERLDKRVGMTLIERGAQRAVLKLGQRGSLAVCNDGHFYRVGPFQVEVVDTTAAGDAFTAALGVALGRADRLHEATKFANAAGALACTRYGAQTAMPDALEVQMLMRDQPK
jgi:ribokinase